MKEHEGSATGGCLCGAVTYRILGRPRGVVYCHCSKCRRFHGHVGAYTSVPLENLEFTEKRGLRWFRSTADETPNVHRGFCSECGSSLFWHPRDRDSIAVAAGSLDEPTGLHGLVHVWTSQMADYYDILDDLPGYEKSMHGGSTVD